MFRTRLTPVLALLAGLLAACGGAGTAAPAASSAAGAKPSGAEPAAEQAIVDGARKEGQLTLVWGDGAMGGDAGAKLLADGLNKRYGLNLKVQYTPGPSMPDMSAKILQEFQAGRPASSDVMLGSEAHFPPLMQANALEAVDWASWSASIKDPKLLGAPDGTSVKVASRTPGITYNTTKISGDQAPKNMQDLLKPQYKGKIASTPYAAMFDRLGSDDWWGPQKAIEYVTQLSGQVSGLIRCGETERIASGEFPIFALDCGTDDSLRGQSQGAPLAQVVPSDAAAMVHWYMGVPKNAAHPNAAKLFIDYVMSREGQDIMWKTSSDDEYLVPGSHNAGPIDALKAQGVTFKEIDIAFQMKQDQAATDKLRKQLQNILAKKS
jgi:ABC-type Fe3+ transport system substrate-binding protein